jgi:hypothetical protein
MTSDVTTKSTTTATREQIDAFLAARAKAPSAGSGRLIFALDATASRQDTWDVACQLQAEMFREVGAGLDVQLVYYRGTGECRASKWLSRSDELTRLMERIDCRGGFTQIGKVLAHAGREAPATLVFVGDAVEEKIDDLAHAAGELGRLGVRALMFQEGDDRNAERAFREIARASGGAYCRFDPGAARQLAELLRAAAAYAAGGMQALAKQQQGGAARLLLGQMK